MGASVKGRAGVGKAPPLTGPRKDANGLVTRSGILGANAQREILRQASGTRDVSMKEGRLSAARGGLVELKVTGWQKSKASDSADGGLSALIKWLEKKASSKLGSKARNVKIKKVCLRQHTDRLTVLCVHAAKSGPPSLAAKLRTTTAIQCHGSRLSHG